MKLTISRLMVIAALLSYSQGSDQYEFNINDTESMLELQYDSATANLKGEMSADDNETQHSPGDKKKKYKIAAEESYVVILTIFAVVAFIMIFIIIDLFCCVSGKVLENTPYYLMKTEEQKKKEDAH